MESKTPPFAYLVNNVRLAPHFKKTLLVALLGGLLHGPASANIVVTVTQQGSEVYFAISGLGADIVREADLLFTVDGATFTAGDFSGLQAQWGPGAYYLNVPLTPPEWYLGGRSTLPVATLEAQQADEFTLGWLEVTGPGRVSIEGDLLGWDGAPLTWETVYTSAEPGTLLLLGAGLVVAGAWRRKARRTHVAD